MKYVALGKSRSITALTDATPQIIQLMNYILTLLALSLFTVTQAQKKARFYVGTQARGTESVITLCELDLVNGQVTRITAFGGVIGPGYVSLSPDKKYLYSANQDNSISAFAVGNDGTLALLGTQPDAGRNPCHVSVHPSGKMAFLANYGSGSWAAYPIDRAGKLLPATANFQFSGSGPDKSRQEKPHAHCAVPSPNGRNVYVTDLGTDRVMNYTVDIITGRVLPNAAQPEFSTKPGAGPRHLVVHSTGNFLYLLNELHTSLTAYALDSQGKATELQTLPTVPADYKENNTSAAIREHPNGRFIYVSNRGYDSIHGYELLKDGTMKSIGEVREGIATPRDFNFDPSGRFLVVGNQKSNDLTVYKVDPKTGKLSFLSKSITLKDPICFQFL